MTYLNFTRFLTEFGPMSNSVTCDLEYAILKFNSLLSLSTICSYYRLQMKFAKVMFYTCQSFCSGGGEYLGRYPPDRYTPVQVHLLGRYPPVRYTPSAGTPPGRYTPRQVHPLGRYTPSLADTSPLVGTPPMQVHPLDRYTPPLAGTPPRQVHP